MRNVKLILPCISNGPSLWSVWQFILIQQYNYSKILSCLALHLTDKHKIYWLQKYVMPPTFVEVDYLLNYIGLKTSSAT